MLYDAKYRSLFRMPMYDKSGKKLSGVAEYLEGLALNTRVEEQLTIQQDKEREHMAQKLRSLGYM